LSAVIVIDKRVRQRADHSHHTLGVIFLLFLLFVQLRRIVQQTLEPAELLLALFCTYGLVVHCDQHARGTIFGLHILTGLRAFRGFLADAKHHGHVVVGGVDFIPHSQTN
jgi:hypothetical protein